MKKKLLFILLLLPGGIAAYYFYPEAKFPEGKMIDRIIVLKSKNKMMVYEGGQVLKTYSVSLGKNSTGAKEYEGDMRTPEGLYTITSKNPNSGYYKNLGISYPNERDIQQAKQLGKPTGGDIKIHGLKNGHGYIGKFQRWKNWTNGCIALTNEEVEELYNHVPVGTPIEIKP